MPLVAATFGKGPMWQRFDRFLSRADPGVRLERKSAVLGHLRAGEPFTAFDPKSSTMPPDQLERLKQHINADWFGGEAWPHWTGDVEGVVRETIARAIEVSLGLGHGEEVPGEPRRNWPIEFWTVAAAQWFAASLTWRHDRDDEQHGLVTVTWLMPTARVVGVAATSESVQACSSDSSGGVVDPDEARGRFGSWIICQQEHETVGEPAPPADVRSTGKVVTVAPSVDDGGVNPDPDY